MITWIIDAMLNSLKTELEARERCNAVKTSGPTNNVEEFDQHKARVKQSFSTFSLHTGGEDFSPQCVFYMTITETKARRTMFRRSGRCFVCLKSGHISPNRQSRVKCFNCECRHYVTICEKNVVQCQNSVPQ